MSDVTFITLRLEIWEKNNDAWKISYKYKLIIIILYKQTACMNQYCIVGFGMQQEFKKHTSTLSEPLHCEAAEAAIAALDLVVT